MLSVEFIITMVIVVFLTPFLLISARRTMDNLGLGEDEDELSIREYSREKRNRRVVVGSILSGVAGGVICASLQFLPVEVAKWLAILFLLVLLFAAVQLCYVWHKKHEDQKEWLQLLWLALPAAGVVQLLRSAVMGVRLWFDNPFWGSVLGLIPWLVGVSIVGFFTASAFYLRADNSIDGLEDEDDDDEEEDDGDEEDSDDEDDDADGMDGKWYTIFGRITIVLTKLILILLLVFGINWGSISHGSSAHPSANPGSSTGFATETAKELFWCTFLNDELQTNNNDADDLFFAVNPYKKGMSAADAKAIHRQYMQVDPANGTTAMCWVDQHTGTRYMGDKFYSQYKGKDDVAINTAKEVYIDNRALYGDTLTPFLAWLDTASVEIREVDEGITDQFYQVPGRYTFRGIPDVAVFESAEQGGHYLVYTFVIKGRAVEVPFRIECGFQPCNVTEYLDVTVKSDSEKPSGGGNTPGSNTPGSTEPGGQGSDETQPATEPANSNLKDKSKGTQGQVVGQNDNSGDGGSTNTGKGSSTSAKDNAASAGGSTTGSKNEYDRRVEQLREADNASSSSSSTASGSSGVTTDGNGRDADRASGNSGVVSAINGDTDAQTWDGSDI